MFEGLDDIHWSVLRHCRGPATDIPASIRSLMSQDHEERWEAFGHLADTILHQGTVYEATAYAVPFLIELLKRADLPEEEIVVTLLANIAAGDCYYRTHPDYQGTGKSLDRIVGTPGRTLGDELEREKATVEAVRRACAPGLTLLIPYLTRGEDSTRSDVAHAFGKCPSRKAELLPALEAALLVEQDEEASETIPAVISELRNAK